MEAFIRPFDLTQAPLLRVEVLQLAEEKHLLLLDMPHIISDGVSMGVLVEEFTQLYAGKALPALRIQYKDYAVWEQERQGSEAMKANEAYWLEQFDGRIAGAAAADGLSKACGAAFRGDRVSFTLDREHDFRAKTLGGRDGNDAVYGAAGRIQGDACSIYGTRRYYRRYAGRGQGACGSGTGHGHVREHAGAAELSVGREDVCVFPAGSEAADAGGIPASGLSVRDACGAAQLAAGCEPQPAIRHDVRAAEHGDPEFRAAGNAYFAI